VADSIYYFQSVPITLEAIPNEGFEFSHWSGDISSSEQKEYVNMLRPMTLEAHFVKDGTATKDVANNSTFSVFPNPFTSELTV